VLLVAEIQFQTQDNNRALCNAGSDHLMHAQSPGFWQQTEH